MNKPVVFILCLFSLKAFAQPVNDNTCNATVLSVGMNSPFTNVGATVQANEPAVPTGPCNGQLNWCSGEPSPQLRSTVWFRFTVPSNGTGSYSFRVNGNAAGFDSQIALFSAASCTDLTNGNAVLRAANDDSAGTPFHSYMTAYCLTPAVTYYIMVDGYGTNTNSNFYIDIVELPHSYAVANAGLDQTVCYSLFPEVQLTGSVAGTPGSTQWTTTGDGYFTNASQLITTYVPGPADKANGLLHLILSTDNPPGNCNATVDSLLLNVIADSLSAGADLTLCAEEDYLQLNGQQFLFTSFEWTSLGDGIVVNEASLNAKYYPGVNDRSSSYFELVLRGVSTQCFNTVYDTVRVFNSLVSGATVVLPSDGVVCFSDSIQLSPEQLSNYSSVIWTTSGDGSFTDPASPSTIYIPGVNDVALGTVVVTLSAAGNSPCNGFSEDSRTLTLSLQPEITSIIYGSSYCSTDIVALSASVQDYSSLSWTTSGDGAFTDSAGLSTIYIPGPMDFATGTVQVTLVANAVLPCTAPSSQVISFSVAMAPSVTADLPSVSCAGEPIHLNAAVSDYASINWSSGGDGFFDNSNLVKPVYTPGVLDVALGFVSFNIVVLGNTPCNAAFDGGTVAINDIPMVNAGPDQQACSGSAVSLNAIAQNYSEVLWSTDGDGLFDDTTSLSPVYVPGANDLANGNVNLFVTVSGISPCLSSSVDVVSVGFTLHASADAGPDDDVVSGQHVNLDGFADGASLAFWTTSGDGTFNDSSLLNAVYTPGSNDLTQGNVVLFLTAVDELPCSATVTDSVVITIYPDALLAIKLYIEGLKNDSTMTSPLYNLGLSDQTVADSVTIAFHETISPYSAVHEYTGAVGVNGLIFITLPSPLAGNSYYLSIRHRNSIETWSRQPFTIDSFSLLDLTASPVLRPSPLAKRKAGSAVPGVRSMP